MTEADWLSCADPEALLKHCAGRLDARQYRLFACACCRRVWRLIRDPSCRQAVEAAEAFVDGLLTEAELEEFLKTAHQKKPLFADANWAACWCADLDAEEAATEAAYRAAMSVADAGSEAAKSRARAAVCSGAPEADKQAAWENYEQVVANLGNDEARAQADLLRDIVGNPFRKVDWSTPLPLTVVDLAEALYAGDDCAFALHDALLEAGRADLAEHFADPSRPHPKGCWVLDGILGK